MSGYHQYIIMVAKCFSLLSVAKLMCLYDIIFTYVLSTEWDYKFLGYLVLIKVFYNQADCLEKSLSLII